MNYDDMSILDFLNTEKDWYNILSKDYHVAIHQKDEFTLLKYNQIDTPKCWLTDQCRGSIFYQDENSKWQYACRPFNRFYNYEEERAAKIDWSSANITSKMDGSIIKIWCHNNIWHYSTNGTIDAFESPLSENPLGILTFGGLLLYALQHIGRLDLPFDLNPSYTHLFELCTRLNKVVVDHPEPTVYYLTSIHTETGKEVVMSLNIPRPKEYFFKSIDDCIAMAKTLPFKDEGYVVKDKYNNRLKIKSPQYIAVHHIRGESAPNNKRLLELMLLNEDSEFLSYFPEYTEAYMKVKDRYLAYVTKCTEDWNNFKIVSFPEDDRKAKAIYITKNCLNTDVMFRMMDGKDSSVEEAIRKMRINNLLMAIDKM